MDGMVVQDDHMGLVVMRGLKRGWRSALPDHDMTDQGSKSPLRASVMQEILI